ncbi:GlxA family transcriptional regulator [Burkholderia gladioli]|uniref:GlxA family transcriptional regulator n=1 Tax=Burkholderia gladioli TaxID=28095 RepID=UPI001640A4E8|nr:helix-turn-helix domain-containing protein [Burkholderia gladioli]
MNIDIFAIDGVADFGLSSVLETLSYANQLAARLDPVPAPIEVTLVGMRRRVRTINGMTVPVKVFDAKSHADAVVAPAIGALDADTIELALERAEMRDVKAALIERSRSGTWIGAACTATFVLADTGLLDDHAATTSWWLAPVFRRRYPKVRLDDSRMLVASPPFVTAGAGLSHVDLALGLVRRRSPALAALTARFLIFDSRTSQAAYAIPDHLSHADPVVERFETWARRNLARGFSLAEAASAAGTSERTLSRRMHATLGRSPLAFFQDLRVEHAVHLLQTTHSSVDQIATQVGYADGVTLATLLRRKLGKSIRELRQIARAP